MASTSKAQQHFMGMLYANPGLAKKRGIDMSTSQLKDFASTKTKNLPAKIGDHKKRGMWRDMAKKK